jgi:hypothetical protein
MAAPYKFDTLNTSFVNLAALIRYLREKQFNGRLHIELDQYESDVFLYGPDSPSAWENDRATGREAQGDGVMQRLLVRAREPGGVITVYETIEEKSGVSTANSFIVPETFLTTPVVEVDLTTLVAAAGELIAVIERASDTARVGFAERFHLARVELGDDYPFIDPTSGSFEYSDGAVTLESKPQPTTFVQAVSESLRRVVSSIAQEPDSSSFRELVAVELAVLSRRVGDGLGDFTSQLNRIAGTQVL